MSKESKELGKKGEDLAVDLLIQKNYTIIERNYTFEKKGEIDIVAKDPETGFLVFVEVKTRANLNYGEPEYGITKNKMMQVKKIAEIYLYEKEIDEVECRFDVISVLFQGMQKPVINHYVDAFR